MAKGKSLDKFKTTKSAKKTDDKPLRTKTKGMKSSPAKGADLNELADVLSKKYGVDVQTILQLLLEWGPKIVELALSLFKKTPKGGMGCCPTMVTDHLNEIINSQMEALATSLCLRHCVECCADDDDECE